MTKKKKKSVKPWCWYCDREFDDEGVLIQHQRQKHFKCTQCSKRLNTAGGLGTHMAQVHKETLKKILNTIPGRDDPNIEIFGMEGVPESDLQAHIRLVNGGEPEPKKAKLDDSAASQAATSAYPGMVLPGAGVPAGAPAYGYPPTHAYPMQNQHLAVPPSGYIPPPARGYPPSANLPGPAPMPYYPSPAAHPSNGPGMPPMNPGAIPGPAGFYPPPRPAPGSAVPYPPPGMPIPPPSSHPMGYPPPIQQQGMPPAAPYGVRYGSNTWVRPGLQGPNQPPNVSGIPPPGPPPPMNSSHPFGAYPPMRPPIMPPSLSAPSATSTTPVPSLFMAPPTATSATVTASASVTPSVSTTTSMPPPLLPPSLIASSSAAETQKTAAGAATGESEFVWKDNEFSMEEIRASLEKYKWSGSD